MKTLLSTNHISISKNENDDGDKEIIHKAKRLKISDASVVKCI